MTMLRILYTLLISILFLTSARADGSSYAPASALSSGKWVKIQIQDRGFYKLTYSELQGMGFSDPAKVSVHGYGGCVLPEDFSNPYIDDVPAVPVWRGDDYLLFYGCGVVKWEYDQNSGSFIHTNNPYSDYGYYFLTDATDTRQMESVASTSGASMQISTYDDYLLHERDLVSVNNSGRELYGEAMDVTLSRDFTFSIPGVTNDDGKATLRFIAKPTNGNGSVTMSIGGETLLEKGIANSSATADIYTQARLVYDVVDWRGDKSESVRVNVRYGQSGHRNVHLDFIRLQVKRQLQPYGAVTFFRSLASVENASRFVVQNANANTLIFDVTDVMNPKLMETQLSGSELSFSVPAGGLREFAMVQRNQTLPSPTVVGEVANQNLHALPQTDMIIISQPGLAAQAERLAEVHRTADGLSVEVVAPEAIYNEFSSGTPDASAYRRFMKMFYDRQTSEDDAPKYLLLFGDGAFDNRFITSGWQNVTKSNMLLTYQTESSLDETSYVIDDYFGFLDDYNNGRGLTSMRVDIGIGRFPVRTLAEATNMVDKVIKYMNNEETGSWKNNVCFVADDGNSGETPPYTTAHMSQADQLAEYLNNSHPEFLVNKIYFDSYKKDFSGGLSTYPDVRNNIQKQLRNGLLLINYTGHGNTVSWSDEKILTESDITQSTYTRLPIWITATCDFCRFDAPVTSAGEQVFLNKLSGGIGLFTTTRVAYSTPNFTINDNLIRNLFEKKNGQRQTLGEVMKATKRALGSSRYKLGFALIGDPALKLSYPEYRMQVTTVNGEPVTNDPVSFKALQRITVEGEVLNPSGNVATDFNGLLNPTVMDSRLSYETLDNNKTGRTFKYTDYSNVLFIGNDSVRSGKFSFTFTVPKDISYSNEFGKMNLYAVNEATNTEAQGAYLHYRVGGTDDNAENDADGPEIRALYLNDSTFVSGDQVNNTPFFVARLWDKSGVNITGSSIGHDMTLTIDGSPYLSYNLNSYYELTAGADGEGIVKYLLPALAPGKHTAEFKVWDIQNNSTTQTFEFEVVEGLKPFLLELSASPSPAREQVTFRLFHNRPESQLTVGIMVYDMMGRLQWSHQETGSSELFKSYTVNWDLCNNRGGRLRPGIYIYRAAISGNGSKEATDAKKLIILAQ